MGPLTSGDDDANTPLDGDALAGLRPSWVATREDLNEVEAANVASGMRWLTLESPDLQAICTSDFTRELHRRMFGDVWKWAGQYRTSDLNIGIEWWSVTEAVEQLVSNFALRLARTQVSGELLDIDCVDLHHQMVAIHPFPNGNGRHARAMADAAAVAGGSSAFTWGRSTIAKPGEARRAYLDSLRIADGGDLFPLVQFARS